MRLLCILGSAIFVLGCSGGDGTNPDGSTDDSGSNPDGSVPLDDSGNPIDSSMQQDTGPITCNGVMCKQNESCLNNTSCVCNAGFVPGANGCDPAPQGSPAAHTQMEVCQKWKDGHVVTTPNPFTKGSNMCDPGTLAAGGIADTLKRINTFRWMEAIGDVTDNAMKNQGDQACAVIQAWNNPNNLGNPHAPPMNATCYTSLGAMWAGQSNLAWGTSTSDSIDLYIQDPGAGNATSLGHRRWVLHPKLGAVGIGYYSGGNNGFGGNAQCLGVFDTSSSGPKPSWYAWPPPGFVPVQITKGVPNQGWGWSFHVTKGGVIGNAMITVRDMGAGKDVNVTVQKLNQGYGDDAISFYPSGWTPTADNVYRVTVNVPNLGTYTYDVRPFTCQ